MKLSRIVFFDVETSGLEPPPSAFFQGRYASAKGRPWQWMSTPHHEIIQIAAVAVDESWEIIDRMEAKIHFNFALASSAALDMNSFDAKVWQRDAVPSHRAMAWFREFLVRHSAVHKISKYGNPYMVAKLAGHNVARFDLPFLVGTYEALGMGFFQADYIPLDTLQLAAWWQAQAPDPPENLKLTTLAEHFGIQTDGAHDALADVEMNVAVARELISRMKGGPA